MGRFHKLRVGNAEIIALQDSLTYVDRAPYFPNVPEEAWTEYTRFLAKDGQLLLNFGVWLIHSAGQTILVDTGCGWRPAPNNRTIEEPQLPRVMQEAGVGIDDVDVVVFTHLHWDHTGWNTVDENGSPTPLFPKARHVMQRVEWEFWSEGSEKRKAIVRFDDVLEPIAAAGLIDLVESDYAVTPEVVALPTPGHTPGHVAFVVGSGNDKAYMIGDAAHFPVQVIEPGWSPAADLDPELSTRTRAALWERIEREGSLVASGHFPFPGLGKVGRRNGGREFLPIALE